MKKSSKLLISLGSISGTAVVLATGLSVGIVLHAKPKKELSQQIETFEQELKSNKKLNDSQKLEIKKAIDNAKKVLNSDKSTNSNFKDALLKLVSQVSEIKKNTIDVKNNNSLEAVKSLYNTKLDEANKLLSSLLDDKYKEAKIKLESSINTAKKEISDKSSVEQFKQAANKIANAIDSAKESKQMIDGQHGSDNTNNILEKTKQEYKKQKDIIDDQLTYLSGPKYAEIKSMLEKEVNEIVKNINDNSTAEQFEAATKKLKDASEKAKKMAEPIDDEIEARVEFDNNLNAAKKISKELESDSRYKAIKDELDKVIQENENAINDKSTKEQIDSISSVLIEATLKAKNAKRDIDDAQQEKDSKLQALASFNKIAKEVEDYSKTLTNQKHDDIKKQLDDELKKQQEVVKQDSSDSEKIEDATKKLSNLLEQAKNSLNKNTDAKKKQPDANVEENLTEEQQKIVDKINNKSIVSTSSITDDVKNTIITILKGNSRLSNEREHHYFGYVTFDQKNDFMFSEKKPNKKNKAKNLGSGIFSKDFVDLWRKKEILFASNSNKKNSRKALCLEKKADGKIVLPFKFKGHSTIYEIELFQLDTKA
ncbi:hypothetical protein ACWXVO_02050 [Mycoplasma sp. 1890]